MGSEARKLFGVFCIIHQALTDITPLYGVPNPCDRDHSTQGRSKKKHQEACREQERINSTMTISVTALAQAAALKQINPTYKTGQYLYQMWGGVLVAIGLPPLDFVDDLTAAQMAQLLGGKVYVLPARTVWPNGNPNGYMPPNVPGQNFIGFAGMPTAPNSGDILLVNGGDLAQVCTQAYYFGVPEEDKEQALAYLIPSATMSEQAQADLAGSPILQWASQPQYWWNPNQNA
jgi:hypothetical protein